MITLTSFFLKLKWLYSHLNSYRYFDIIPLSITRYDGCNIKEELANSILKQQIKKLFFYFTQKDATIHVPDSSGEWMAQSGWWKSVEMALSIHDSSHTGHIFNTPGCLVFIMVPYMVYSS